LKSKQVQEFKETEIGKIPSDWKVKKLIELAKTKSDIVAGPFGSNLIVDDYRSQGIPIIRLQNIERYHFIKKDIKFIDETKYDELKYHSFKAGDIVLAKLGDPIGKTCILPNEFLTGIVTADVVRIRIPHNEVDNYFLLYNLNSNNIKNQLYSRQLGTTRPRVNLSDVRELLLPIPPLTIQQKIGKILFCLDIKIENLQNQNKVLDQIVQAIFKSWFVKFDGITKFEDSKLGKIPKGWKVVKIDDVIKLLYGKSLTVKNRKQGNVPVFGSSGIIGFHNKYLCSSSGIIVGRKGNVGSVFWSQNPFYVIDTAYYVKTELPLHYVYRNFQKQNFIDSDTSVPGLSRNQAYSLPILIPDKLSLERFENFASKIQILFEKNNQSISQLEQIRDTLLPKLMSGEIRI